MAAVGDAQSRACAVVLVNVRDRLTTTAIRSIKLVRNIDQVIAQLKTEISMDAATCLESTAAGIANTLTNLGASLRFNDPNGLTLEFTSKVQGSSECKRTSRSCAHAELQRWLLQRQNWWRRRPFHENSIMGRHQL
jgi:hypothetical protein